MSTDLLLLAGLALCWPLLPFGLLLNAGYDRVSAPVLRAVLIVAVPLAGVALASAITDRAALGPAQAYVNGWALAGALLYGWRLLSVRDLFVWSRLYATSATPLLWLAFGIGASVHDLAVLALGLSLPAAVLTGLAGSLAARTGGAWLGSGGRLGSRYPKLAVVLAASLAAALAAPPFPSFFALLHLALHVDFGALLALALLGLLWTWAVARLCQHAFFGDAAISAAPAADGHDHDLGLPTRLALLGLAALAVSLTLHWSWSWWTP